MRSVSVEIGETAAFAEVSLGEFFLAKIWQGPGSQLRAPRVQKFG